MILMSNRRGPGSFRQHLILTSGIATCVFASLMASGTFLPLARALEHSEPGSSYSAAIAELFLELHRTFWPVVLGALIASVTSAMLLYYRMVGPLVRFRQVYRQLAAGHIPGDLTLRSWDYLTTDSDALNQLLAALRNRRADREARVTRCERVLDEIAAPDREIDANGHALIDELREELKSLR
jgi:hypothetical protein